MYKYACNKYIDDYTVKITITNKLCIIFLFTEW